MRRVGSASPVWWVASFAALAVAGCASPTKRHYLHHLSVTIAPAPPDDPIVALFDARRPTAAPETAVAAVDTDR
jgi:hypothetical protein